jgi:hypothetical protein
LIGYKDSRRYNPNNPVVVLRSRWSLHSSDSADRGRSIVRVIDGTDRSVLKQSHDYEDFSATGDEWRVNEA